MFGAEIAAVAVYQALAPDATIQAAVDNRILAIEIVPEGVATPAVLHHPTGSTYEGPISGPAAMERVLYAVRLVCEGISTDPIWAAAERQMAILDGNQFAVVVNEEQYTVGFTATGETIPTTVYEDGNYYRLLGTNYDVDVTKG